MKENTKRLKISDYFYFHLGSLSWINGVWREGRGDYIWGGEEQEERREKKSYTRTRIRV